MDNAEVEWRAHTTQIRRIEADTKKHRQEVLTTTNTIEDAIQKNNVIFGEKWEMTHDRIDHRSEEFRLLKNRVVDLEALSGLQQTATNCSPVLPKYYSWAGGDRFEVGRFGYCSGEVGLSLLQSVVVTWSALCVGGGGSRGDGGGGGGS